MGTSRKRAERRTLCAIERDLSAGDPRLAGMFLTFTRVNRGDDLPAEDLPAADGPKTRPAHRAWLRVKAFTSACFQPSDPTAAGQLWLRPPGTW